MDNRSSESTDYPATNKGNERSFVANPRASKPGETRESAGPIASDSLAADSVRSGGGFAENKDSTPLGVRGASSTLANDDTTNANVLNAAPSAVARQQREFQEFSGNARGDAGGRRYPDDGQPTFTGVHSDQGYVGGASSADQARGTSSSDEYSGRGGIDTSDRNPGFDSSMISSSGITASNGVDDDDAGRNDGSSGVSSGLGSRADVDTAPTYIADTTGALRTDGELRPKGDNLTEGGDIPPNRSTYTGDVGGPKDPGRLAEAQFSRDNAQSGVGIGSVRSSNARTDVDQGGFENLDSSEKA